MGSNDTSPVSLDADEIIKEAFAVSQGEAVSIVEEGIDASGEASPKAHGVAPV